MAEDIPEVRNASSDTNELSKDKIAETEEFRKPVEDIEASEIEDSETVKLIAEDAAEKESLKSVVEELGYKEREVLREEVAASQEDTLGGVSATVVEDTGINPEPVANEDNTVAAGVSEESIIKLLDRGFACRGDKLMEAVNSFEEALSLTSDYELKYLLTMELVDIYKDYGWYNRAVSILRSFIALPDHKSDIINEINQQIDYITLLATELDRLGMSNLPVSRVPRWVRLKVDAEMNPPGV